MTNEGRTYSFTLQKSPWLINAPPLPPSPHPNHPLIFTAMPLLFLFLYSLSARPHSFRCICTHVRFNRLLYMEFWRLIAACTMFSHFSRVKKKKKFPWNFTSLTTLPNLCNSISYQFFSIGHWSIATARGIWLLASWTPLCMPCAPYSFFFPSKNIFSRVNNKGAIIHP